MPSAVVRSRTTSRPKMRPRPADQNDHCVTNIACQWMIARTGGGASQCPKYRQSRDRAATDVAEEIRARHGQQPARTTAKASGAASPLPSLARSSVSPTRRVVKLSAATTSAASAAHLCGN